MILTVGLEIASHGLFIVTDNCLIPPEFHPDRSQVVEVSHHVRMILTEKVEIAGQGLLQVTDSLLVIPDSKVVTAYCCHNGISVGRSWGQFVVTNSCLVLDKVLPDPS